MEVGPAEVEITSEYPTEAIAEDAACAISGVWAPGCAHHPS